MDQAVPDHVDEPDQLVGGPGPVTQAQAVPMDEAFPVPVPGTRHAGFERLGVKQVGSSLVKAPRQVVSIVIGRTLGLG